MLNHNSLFLSICRMFLNIFKKIVIKPKIDKNNIAVGTVIEIQTNIKDNVQAHQNFMKKFQKELTS